MHTEMHQIAPLVAYFYLGWLLVVFLSIFIRWAPNAEKTFRDVPKETFDHEFSPFLDFIVNLKFRYLTLFWSTLKR